MIFNVKKSNTHQTDRLYSSLLKMKLEGSKRWAYALMYSKNKVKNNADQFDAQKYCLNPLNPRVKRETFNRSLFHPRTLGGWC